MSAARRGKCSPAASHPLRLQFLRQCCPVASTPSARRRGLTRACPRLLPATLSEKQPRLARTGKPADPVDVLGTWVAVTPWTAAFALHRERALLGILGPLLSDARMRASRACSPAILIELGTVRFPQPVRACNAPAAWGNLMRRQQSSTAAPFGGVRPNRRKFPPLPTCRRRAARHDRERGGLLCCPDIGGVERRAPTMRAESVLESSRCRRRPSQPEKYRVWAHTPYRPRIEKYREGQVPDRITAMT